MNALDYLTDQDPAVPPRTITCDVRTLAAACQIAYQFGRAESAPSTETLHFLRRTIRNMQHSLRRPRPVPQAGVEAGLALMLAACDERLGIAP